MLPGVCVCGMERGLEQEEEQEQEEEEEVGV